MSMSRLNAYSLLGGSTMAPSGATLTPSGATLTPATGATLTLGICDYR